MTINRHIYNPMKTVPFGIKLTEDEQAEVLAIQARHPMVPRAAMGELLVILGAIEYWKRPESTVPLDPAKVLAEARKQREQHQKKPKK